MGIEIYGNPMLQSRRLMDAFHVALALRFLDFAAARS